MFISIMSEAHIFKVNCREKKTCKISSNYQYSAYPSLSF